MSKVITFLEPNPKKSKSSKTENPESTHFETTNLPSSRTTTLEKEKHKRVITTTKKWRFEESDYSPEKQLDILKNICLPGNLSEKMRCAIQEIGHKINGYKAQDIAKNMYSPDKFITKDRVIELLVKCELKCHYCKKDVKILYEWVREPTQWTLDRIDNSQGHNGGNLFISCLSCNLRRRTIYHEKYEITKICTNVIKLD